MHVMYASDFLQKGLSSQRMYLSGENSFVKGLVIDKILKDWNSPQVIKASKKYTEICLYSERFLWLIYCQVRLITKKDWH